MIRLIIMGKFQFESFFPAEEQRRESGGEVHDGPAREQNGVARQERLLAAEAVWEETAGHETAHAEELHDAHCGTNRGGYYKSA